jgi:hypothetical protein
MIRRIEISEVWTAVEANHDRTSVYTDEYLAGLEDSFPLPGLPQGEIHHGFR